MRRADIEVPNLPVDVNSWGRLACYPRGNFYPLSDSLSTQHCLITKTNFRFCSACQPHSQAPICLYALHRIAIPDEGTFALLRYSLGGDRPSQTAHQAMSCARLYGVTVRSSITTGWYFTIDSIKASALISTSPTYTTQLKPKIKTKLQ